MAEAGCGSHTAVIADRTGAIITQANVLVEVEWQRLLDDTSGARVVVSPEGDCCEQLGQVRSWRHRLLIYRDSKPVWDGPVIDVNWKLGNIEITAADVSAWLARRVIHTSMVFGDSDLMEIAQWIIEDAFAPDDPGHMVEVVGRARVRGARSYIKDVGQSFDHLADLAETGIDFTVVGHKIILLPETHLESIGRLSDVDFPAGLTVAEDGKALATRWVVAGDDDGDVLGSAGGVDPYYGLLERYLEQTSITDDTSATAAAQAKLRASLPAPVFIDSKEVTLSPQAAIDVALLVPGWCLDITSAETCRMVTQRLKIVGLTVTETGGDGDDPGGEQVQVQVAATGTEATSGSTR